MVRDRNASHAAAPGRGFAGSLERFAVAGLLALFGAAWYATAWVSDDAFITLRTIDNALAGHGLVWNVGERVQTYTHPLWMLALLVASAPLGEPYFAALALGGVCTALTLGLLVRRIAASLPSALLVLALLFGSRAFIDYSSSGLENPLAHLLLVGLFVACARVASDRRTQLVRGLLACSLLLVRLDFAFLIAPLLLGAWSRDGFPAVRTLVVAGLPLLAWELFSLVYYGAWIANSALAKLSADVPLAARWLQGGHYLLAMLRGDPVSAVLLVAGLTAGIRVGSIGRWASAAIVGQLGWVVWVGGDFMAGRFLTAPLVLAAALVAHAPVPPPLARAAAALLVVAVLGIPYLSPFAARDYGETWHAAIDDRGIADERSFHRTTTSLRAVLGDGGWRTQEARESAQHTRENYYLDPWIESLTSVGVLDEGEAWPPRDAAAAAAQTPVLVKGGVGLLGVRMGPEVVLVDYHGLGDPLLARLPALPRDPVLANLIPRLAHLDWRVGHYLRPVPAGYVVSRATDENRIVDPDLSHVYENLRRVTGGPLWSRERLAAIVALHSPGTRSAIQRYVARAAPYQRGPAAREPVSSR